MSSEVDPASLDLLTVPSFLVALHLCLVHFGFDVNLFPCDFKNAESTVSGTLNGILSKSVQGNLGCDLVASVSKICIINASSPNRLEQRITLSLRSMKRVVAARIGYVVYIVN